MKKLFSLFAILFFIAADAQVTLSPVSQHTITPTSNDTAGPFCRIYHHPSRNKFYVTYACRHFNSGLPQGVMQEFRWREYDASFSFTGNEGIMPSFTSSGDYAMVMIDSTYYQLTNQGSTSSGQLKYRLTKFDDDFNFIDSVNFTLNVHDSNIDQLMNYTNGKLIIGAMHDSCCTPPTTPPQPNYNPNIRLYQYDLNLNPVASAMVLQPKSYSWGASCIFNAGAYYILTMDNFTSHHLYAYKYDAGFNYQSSTLLSTDGQWSQGVLFDGGYFYLAYHTGEHNHGNVVVAVYDVNWNQVGLQQVTNNLYSDGLNAQRPFLCKQGNLLYVSYDLETYDPSSGINNKDWQAHVDIFQVTVPLTVPAFENENPFVNLFPNPSTDFTTIKTGNLNAGKKNVRIHDITGNLISEFSFEGDEYRLNMNSFYSGVYFIEITDSEMKTACGKLLVQ